MPRTEGAVMLQACIGAASGAQPESLSGPVSEGGLACAGQSRPAKRSSLLDGNLPQPDSACCASTSIAPCRNLSVTVSAAPGSRASVTCHTRPLRSTISRSRGGLESMGIDGRCSTSSNRSGSGCDSPSKPSFVVPAVVGEAPGRSENSRYSSAIQVVVTGLPSMTN